MVNKSRVSVLEQDSSEFNIGRESGDSDFLVCGGLTFKNSDDFLIERIGDVLKLRYPQYSCKANYNGDNIANVEYFSGTNQITANRIAIVLLNYSGDLVTTETLTIYDTADGTTALRSIVSSFTYSGDNITSVTISES